MIRVGLAHKKTGGPWVGPYLIRNKMGGFVSSEQISTRFAISKYVDITSGFIFIKPLIRLFTIYVLIICNITQLYMIGLFHNCFI